jgi:DNA-binding CsgD family transcriptional regulator
MGLVVGQAVVDEFLHRSLQATSVEELQRAFQKACAMLGYNRFLYAAVRNHPDVLLPWSGSSYPDSWLKHYMEKGYDKTDPIRSYVGTVNGGFTWNDLRDRLPASRRLIFYEAEEAGLRSGVGVALHGPLGQLVGFGMASDQNHQDTPEAVAALSLLAVQMHAAYSRICGLDPPEAPHLTARETEVLKWCSSGASAWQISEQLQLSQASVEWHLKNIYDKLGVANRTGAVAKAMSLGLLF